MSPDPTRPLRLRLPLHVSVARLYTSSGYTVHSGPPRQRRLDLYDTADRRLTAVGGELRRSARDGWSWRRETLGHPRLAAREWTASSSDTAVVAQWTRAFSRGAALAARAHIRTVEVTHTVAAPDATPLLTVHDQRVDERTGATWTPRLRRVEVAVADHGRGTAGACAIVAAAGVADESTLLAALQPRRGRAAALHPPAAGVVDAAGLLARSLVLSMIQWLYFDCELRAGASPDALRRLRVALRRLRSDLVTFRPLVDRAWADDLRAALAGVATRLGAVRDREVRVARLTALTDRLPIAERGGATSLLGTATSELAGARDALLAVLDGSDYLDLVGRAIAAVSAPHWRDAEDHQLPAVRDLVRRPRRRLGRFVADIGPEPSGDDLHRVRILAKRARYAADAVAPACGEAAARSAARLADLQTILGEHHDAAESRAWLQAQAAGAAAEVAFAAGELAGLELVIVQDAEHRWRSVWEAASRREGWRWLRS